ncbi:beta-lactamase/transpeptidase-like protein [Mycena leptocephala]|nr:beta-lactamase/transpeptidase-like protein [Mycena leptocephala]
MDLTELLFAFTGAIWVSVEGTNLASEDKLRVAFRVTSHAASYPMNHPGKNEQQHTNKPSGNVWTTWPARSARLHFIKSKEPAGREKRGGRVLSNCPYLPDLWKKKSNQWQYNRINKPNLVVITLLRLPTSHQWLFVLYRRCLLFCLLSLLSDPNSTATVFKGGLITSEIDSFVNSQLSIWNSSGLSVAVLRQDTSSPGKWDIEFGSYGTAQADGSPVTPDTLFAIASNSKLFLSISVGLLIKNESLAAARGEKLRWDTKIKDVIPEWGLMDDEMQNGVMIQDMLSHRTGLPRHDYSRTASRPGGVSELISTLRFLRPSAALRETTTLFAPLGMASSTYSVAEAEERGTLAHGFHWDMQDHLFGLNGTRTATVPHFQRPGEEKISAGAGGVLASARDLSMWVAMLLNKGRHPTTNETVVPEDVVEHVALGVSVARGKATYPELCEPKSIRLWPGPLFIPRPRDNRARRKQSGLQNPSLALPERQPRVIVLSNDENGNSIMETVKWRIVDHVFGLEPIDWAQRYADLLAESIRQNQDVTPRPSPPVLPSVPFSAMEGTFSHGAYGTFQPCFVESKTAGRSAHAQSASADADSIPTFIVPFKRTFATHLRFAHFAGNVFNASLIWSNGEVRAAEGYPAGGDVVVGLDERYEVEWVDGGAEAGGEEGWAFKGNFWGKEGDVRALEGEGRSTRILDSLGSRSILVPAFKSRLVHVAGISRALSLRHNNLLVFSKYVSVERGMGALPPDFKLPNYRYQPVTSLSALPFSFFLFSLWGNPLEVGGGEASVEDVALDFDLVLRPDWTWMCSIWACGAGCRRRRSLLRWRQRRSGDRHLKGGKERRGLDADRVREPIEVGCVLVLYGEVCQSVGRRPLLLLRLMKGEGIPLYPGGGARKVGCGGSFPDPEQGNLSNSGVFGSASAAAKRRARLPARAALLLGLTPPSRCDAAEPNARAWRVVALTSLSCVGAGSSAAREEVVRARTGRSPTAAPTPLLSRALRWLICRGVRGAASPGGRGVSGARWRWRRLRRRRRPATLPPMSARTMCCEQPLELVGAGAADTAHGVVLGLERDDASHVRHGTQEANVARRVSFQEGRSMRESVQLESEERERGR